VYSDPSQRRSLSATTREPTVRHGLVGIAFSGGGIRSAAFNLGLTQALHKRGVFDHVDYMSTVSGGGYLGSSISTLMRSRDGSGGKPLLRQGVAECQSDIAGRVVDVTESSIERTVRIEGERECREHRFTRFDSVVVHTDDRVKAGQDLIRRRDRIADRFAWQVRPVALLREQTTADQFFDEGQFEAYRALGQHVAEFALDGAHIVEPEGEHRDDRASGQSRAQADIVTMSYHDLDTWFKELGAKRKQAPPAAAV
jgi:Patatin-like phospholipase